MSECRVCRVATDSTWQDIQALNPRGFRSGLSGGISMDWSRLLQQNFLQHGNDTFKSSQKWPSGAALGFQEILTSFFLRCKELSLRVLRVMAHSLGLDPEVFLSTHRFIGSDENGTTLRSLYYPPVNSEKAKEGQLRCGEHSGLRQHHPAVRRRSGEFICVPTIPGAVLINIADLMQRWTTDVFVSVLHRVLLPPAGDSSTRQSLAFFVHPDDEALITCCDGSNKYPPVTAGAYLIKRLSDTFRHVIHLTHDNLQVRRRSGEFICVPTIPGAILINIADLMQRWTADVFVSVLHRVLRPPAGDSSTRQSLAFFVHPDDEALITCCDGSNKYPPVTAGAYLIKRLSDTFRHVIHLTHDNLQVRRRSGEFICVPTIPGAVLINIADLMQRWTADVFVSV
ncbi:hypothetical protein L3Q82_023713, partial [Scortum barcoo]